MHPILISFGPIKIFTYGFFIAVGFFTGLYTARREAARQGIEPDQITDFGFYALVAAIAGSRLFYVALSPAYYLSHPLDIFKLWEGGVVFYGAFIGAMLTAVVFFRVRRLPAWKTLDVLSPALAVGHSLGRIGCFFAGCCYGKVCDLPWAVTFTHPNSVVPPIMRNLPLHPTQLYSSASNFLIFLILIAFRRHKSYDGQVFWLYVILYSVLRSIIEIFRGDDRGGMFFGIFSIAQVISFFLAILALVMLWILGRKAKHPKSS